MNDVDRQLRDQQERIKRFNDMLAQFKIHKEKFEEAKEASEVACAIVLTPSAVRCHCTHPVHQPSSTVVGTMIAQCS